jgi:hypothetical protein
MMAFERMLDKTNQPNNEAVAAYIGEPLGECWAALDRFLKETYEVEPQANFSPTYGWSFRYRKSRPLCEILPEKGRFTVLVVLGAKEAAEALAQAGMLGENVRGCLENTQPFHDGRWLWLHVQDERDMEDVKRLILLKRKPIKKKTTP